MGAVGLREWTGAIHVRESHIVFEKRQHEYSIGIAPNVFHQLSNDNNLYLKRELEYQIHTVNNMDFHT